MPSIICTTCRVMPDWQADGLFEETEFRVVKSESLVNDMGCRLHIHLADGHWLAIFCFECNLWREKEIQHY